MVFPTPCCTRSLASQRLSLRLRINAGAQGIGKIAEALRKQHSTDNLKVWRLYGPQIQQAMREERCTTSPRPRGVIDQRDLPL